MFNQRSDFLELQNSRPKRIKLGDGKIVISNKIGKIKLGELMLVALYVPEFKVSLLSVSCLDKNNGLQTTFQQRKTTIRNKERILFTGTLENGIYTLDTLTQCKGSGRRQSSRFDGNGEGRRPQTAGRGQRTEDGIQTASRGHDTPKTEDDVRSAAGGRPRSEDGVRTAASGRPRSKSYGCRRQPMVVWL